jgi:hypothetical protein
MGVLHAAEKTTEGAGKAALEVATGILKAAEESAALAGAEEATKIAGFGIAIGGLVTTAGTMEATKVTTQATLEGIKLTTKGLLAVPGLVLEGLSQTFNIKRIAITARMRELIAGRSPTFEMDVRVLGKDKSISVQIDITKPDTYGDLVKAVISLFAP